MIDLLALTAVIALSIAIGTSVDFTNEMYQSIFIGVPIIFFEPMLVSFTGGSVGHHVVGIRTRKVSIDRKINIIQATLRTVFTLVFGFPSLISVLTSKKHQAIHDFLSMSIVELKDPASLPSYEALEERTKSNDYKYPGAFRRLCMTIVYLVFSISVLFFIAGSLVSEHCVFEGICNEADTIVQVAWSVLFWGVTFVIPWVGWSSRLYGARKFRVSI